MFRQQIKQYCGLWIIFLSFLYPSLIISTYIYLCIIYLHICKNHLYYTAILQHTSISYAYFATYNQILCFLCNLQTSLMFALQPANIPFVSLANSNISYGGTPSSAHLLCFTLHTSTTSHVWFSGSTRLFSGLLYPMWHFSPLVLLYSMWHFSLTCYLIFNVAFLAHLSRLKFLSQRDTCIMEQLRVQTHP